MAFSSQIAVSRRIRIIIHVVLLICILCAVVLPEVDIPPTAMRAQRISFHLLTQLGMLAFVILLWVQTDRSRYGFTLLREETFHPLLPCRLSVTCARLC
jgi:hypothetical protein